MERVIDCPCCFDTDKCFEEVQETYSSFLCFNCGYMSDSRYKIGSIQTTENLKKSPKLVRETMYEDKVRNITWLLSVINMGTLGMIFPEGDHVNHVWKYAKVVDVPEEEREKYGGHDKRLDIENATTYEKYDFISACEDMGMTKRKFD